MFDKVTEADFIRGEHQALKFWTEHRIFEKLREKNANGPEWSFLDGPITANNPMGVHHAWGRTYKDAYQRYHAMRGQKLRYQNGFDCQGLWVEVEVEKELFPKSTKQAIAEYGIDKFVNACKQRVLKFAARQTEQSIRLGYWMDWDHPDELRKLSETVGTHEPITYQPANGEPVTDVPHRIVERLGNPNWGGSYFTFSTENNETIWTFLKTCFTRGKVYRGYDVMPWSGRGGSAYSQMEVADGRKLTTHRSVFARFPIIAKPQASTLPPQTDASASPNASGERSKPRAVPHSDHDAAAQELPPTKDAYHTTAAESREASRHLPESETDPRDRQLHTDSSPTTDHGQRTTDNEYLLVWTTTPWTLTSNVACAVNPDLDYVKLRSKRDGAVYYFAKDNLDYPRLGREFKEGFGRPEWSWPEGVPKLKTISQIFKEQGGFEIEATLKGADLVGWQYQGPFDDLEAQQAPGGWPTPNDTPTQADDSSSPSPNQSAITCHRVIDGGRDSKGNPNVVAGEGTGIVHIAPGCGDIDHQLGKAHGLVGIAPLGEDGTFIEGFGEFTGREAIDPATAELVFQRLRDRHMLVSVEQYPHIYPHCWRTGDELVFRLVDEWFIDMDWRDEIKEVVRTIRWLPESIQGQERELEWLTIMRDWMISKKRFWGLALPIWVDEQTGDFEVMGSLQELEERAKDGDGWDEFAGHTPHRPWIDKVKIRNPKTGNLMTRIPDVGNPWLDAGIVPFSTMQFNTNRDEWQKWYPADFVTECFPGQFRNWFYAMLSMATMMRHEEADPEAKRPFKTLLGHRLVMNEEGKPMHKSDGTAIWFEEAAEQLGVDTMRWMYLAQNPAVDLRFGTRNRDNPVTLRTPAGPVGMTAEGVPTCEVQSKPADEVRRQILIPLWNSYAFFVNYARLDEFDPRAPQIPISERPEIDRWLLSNLQSLIESSNREYENFNVTAACGLAANFIDDLSNWYIRRNRRRFWRSRTAGDQDKLAAYQTLYEVLLTLTKLLAPAIPFLSERMYQNLTGAQWSAPTQADASASPSPSTSTTSALATNSQHSVLSIQDSVPPSVHLCDYPQPNPALLDTSLNERMAAAQLIVRLGHKLREDANLRVRQPLAELQFACTPHACGLADPYAAFASLTEIIQDELNVKRLTARDSLDDLVHYTYKANLKTLGPKYGKLLNTIKQRLPEVDPQQLAPLRTGQPVTVTLDGHELTLQPEDVQVGTEQSADWVVADDRGLQIALSTHLTPELTREGMARDFVRHVQQQRKDAGLEIEDRIRIEFATDDETAAQAIDEWSEYLRTETQAESIRRADAIPDAKQVRVGDIDVSIAIHRKTP